MISVSTDYKNLLANNDSLTPKFKIVVGDVEYLGDVIMAFPKISHSNTSFIGGFPSKKCSFELYNPNNDIDLENKEIIVYKGLFITDSVEWVKQGVFIPQASNITNDITTKHYKVSDAQDKRQLLDVQYVSGLDWSVTHTGLEIVQDALSDTGITLESNSFAWSDYVFNQPNFPSNITKTEVISRMAELGGEIALMNRDGNVLIKGQVSTGDTIASKRYQKLTRENTFGPITTLVFGNEGYDNNIIYKAKNLFNKNNEVVYSNATTITPIENGLRATAIAAGSYLSAGILVPIEKVLNKMVTISANIVPSGSNDGIAILYWLNSNYEPSTNVVPINSTANSYTYQIDSIPEGAEYLGVLLYSNYTSESVSVGDYVDYTNIQLEIGDTATEYEDFVAEKETEWKINDNPYVDLDRENMISLVAPYVIGKSYTPFTLTDFIDGYIYDLNDVLSVVDKNGETFEAVILEYDNSTRIRSAIKAETNDKNDTDYNLAGSSKGTLAAVRFEVDHNSNQIKGLVTKTDDLTTKTSETIQNAEEYTKTFYEEVIREQIDELTGAITTEVETRSAGVRTTTDEDNNVVVELGSSTSAFTLEAKNNGIYLNENGSVLQKMANGVVETPNLAVNEMLKQGPFAWKVRGNKHYSLVKVGDE